MEINASGLYYRELNKKVREALKSGEKKLTLNNVNGQYYIGTALEGTDVEIIINGVPGNDLGAFMSGPTVIINGNAQDNLGNTMNEGKIIVHGNAGDVLGYGMRGGTILVKGNVGYRVGIHMKGFQSQIPVMVIGGCARDFFGEYMAGGVLILLGIKDRTEQETAGDYLGTGMHGGVIYVRGKLDPYRCGKEVGFDTLNNDDTILLEKYVKEYSSIFNKNFYEIMSSEFTKVYPKSSRPYGRLYAY